MLPNQRTTREQVAASPRTVEGLIVSPNRESARPLVEFLRSEGVNVQAVNTAELGFEEALLHRPSVVVIDERISDACGVDLCGRLKANARTHFLPVIMFAHAQPSDLFRLDALAAGADAIFSTETSKGERRARLWALLRSQAMFKRLDGKRQEQTTVISDKRRWVRGLVHDMQNSLGAIQANFEFVAQQSEVRDRKLRGELEDCIRETRNTFREVVRNLRTVLEYERFEAGDVSLRREKVLLSEICENVAAGLGHLASGLHKSLVVDAREYSSPVHGDDKYLYEAICDLVTFVLREPDNQKCFITAASKNGIASVCVYGDRHQIAAAARRGLFDAFAGGHTKEKAARAAHRVGLALAKLIVEAHQGTVTIEDMPGAGTAFVLELPTHWREPRRSE